MIFPQCAQVGSSVRCQSIDYVCELVCQFTGAVNGLVIPHKFGPILSRLSKAESLSAESVTLVVSLTSLNLRGERGFKENGG